MVNPEQFQSGKAPVLLLLLGLGLAAAGSSEAQPFGSWMQLDGTSGYVEVPDSAALNPTAAITIEGWISISASGPCASIVGKNYVQAWWVGICGQTLRSYTHGVPTSYDAGIVTTAWTHFAVTSDGTTRKHYINGELVGTVAENGPLTSSGGSPMRIGSDVAYEFSPTGGIDEVRLWNVARTQAQIQSTINVWLVAPQPGLVAVWSLGGGGSDFIGGHNGSSNGSAMFTTFPFLLCTPSATVLCFEDRDSEFAVSVTWQKPNGATGVGTVVPGFSSSSGVFWFFDPTNWELLVKELDGCAIDGRFWIFSAATTNVHYQLTVLDTRSRVQKMYFNFQGVAAPAVTDTQAFATCGGTLAP